MKYTIEKIPWTIWKFIEFDGNIVYAARNLEPFEPEHEYQKVIAHVYAFTPEEALKKANIGIEQGPVS